MTLPRFLLGFFTLASFLPSTGLANDILPALPADKDILLHNAHLHPISGAPIPAGKLLIRKGRIAALGQADASLPNENAAVQIDCEGMSVYPGLISANGTLGLVEISAVRATRDLSEPGRLNPSVRAEVAINPDSELFPVARSNGLLTSLTVPQTSGLLSGRSALVQLEGWTWEDMVIKAPVGMHLFWPRMRFSSSATEDSRKAQSERIDEQLDGLKTFFDEARAYQKAKVAAEPDFRSDVRLDAMLPVLEKRLPLYVHALGMVEIQSALQFVQAQGVEVVLVSGHDVGRLTDLLKERHIPVVLTSVQDLPLRRWEAFDTAKRVPAKLLAAGIHFCIANGSRSSGSTSAGNLPHIAASAVGVGFSAEDAVRAITLSAAEILGVGDQLGSLETGKLATLIITDGHPLEITTRVRRAFVAGREIDLSSKHTQLYEKYREKQRRLEAAQ